MRWILTSAWVGLVLLLALTKPPTAVAQGNCPPLSWPYADGKGYPTQGDHGASYGHHAVDLAAGKGTTLLSATDGTVKTYTDGVGNTTLEVENECFVVTYLHGEWSVETGDEVRAGQPVGREWNYGNTVDMAGNSCRDRDCGYHVHWNVYVKAEDRSVYPLDLVKPGETAEYHSPLGYYEALSTRVLPVLLVVFGLLLLVAFVAERPQTARAAVGTGGRAMAAGGGYVYRLFYWLTVFLGPLRRVSAKTGVGCLPTTAAIALGLAIGLVALFTTMVEKSGQPPELVAEAIVGDLDLEQIGRGIDELIGRATTSVRANGPPARVFTDSTPTQYEADLLVSLADFTYGEGQATQIRVSQYWPPQGPPNCWEPMWINGQCLAPTKSGERWQDWVDRGIACPPEWPFGTQVQVLGEIWTCVDRGGAIEYVNGIPWIDQLTATERVPYGTVVDATVFFPSGR
jgi:hypothetical protein